MPESTHDLLLALAGRVDDDLLAWARELVAIGEDGQAIDLLTATLIADRVALPAAARAAIVDAGRLSRAGLDADRALPAAADADVSEHRFGGDAPDPDALHRLTAALPAERLRACRVLLAWRLTPAGTAPGPLPQAVVLVESDGSAGLREVLAYQVAAALERARTPAAVEVFDACAPLPAYHAAALDVARPIALGQAGDGARAARRAASDAQWDRAAGDDGGPRPASLDEHVVRDGDRRGAPRGPAPEHTGTRSRPARVAEAGEAAEATDGPRSAERAGPARGGDHAGGGDHGEDRGHRTAQPVRPAARSGTGPGDRVQPEPPTSPGQRPAGGPPVGRRPGDGPGDRVQPEPLTSPGQRPAGGPPVGRRPGDGPDPLSGPLRQPLLEPLLDPTIRPDDPLGLGTEPLAPAPSEASANDDWFSGSWSVPADGPAAPSSSAPSSSAPSSSAPSSSAPSSSAPPSAPPSEAPDGRLPRRRRASEQHDDPAPATPPAGTPSRATPHVAPPPRPARRNRYRPDDEAGPPPDRPEPASDPGPRPESLAALSDTERELLAQLQAELAAREGRPRVSRRAGIAGSPSTNGNGSNPRPRPDTP